MTSFFEAFPYGANLAFAFFPAVIFAICKWCWRGSISHSVAMAEWGRCDFLSV